MSELGDRDGEYIAHLEEWKAFKMSNIWHDLQLFLVDRLELNRDLLETKPEQRPKIQTDDELRGENFSIRLLLEVPDLIINDLTMDKEGEKNVDGRG
jgi:hypothetical protein